MSSVTENNTHVYYAIVAGMIPHGGRSPVVGWEAYPYRYTIDQYNNRVYDRSVKPYPQDLPSNYQSVELVNVTDQQWQDRITGPYNFYETDGKDIFIVNPQS